MATAMKRLELPASQQRVVASAARRGYPYEVCGALIGFVEETRVRVTRAVAIPNTAEEAERRRRFVIDPKAVLQLDRMLRKTADQLVGFYHSHPDHPAAPSPTDLKYLRLWPQTVWLIVPVSNGSPGKARAWWLSDPAKGKPAELELVSAKQVPQVDSPG